MSKLDLGITLFIIIVGFLIIAINCEREDKDMKIKVYKEAINETISKSNAPDLCKDFSNIKPIQW
jgi:hypothetical protein